jgi:hypothetical protein
MWQHRPSVALQRRRLSMSVAPLLEDELRK